MRRLQAIVCFLLFSAAACGGNAGARPAPSFAAVPHLNVRIPIPPSSFEMEVGHPSGPIAEAGVVQLGRRSRATHVARDVAVALSDGRRLMAFYRAQMDRLGWQLVRQQQMPSRARLVPASHDLVAGGFGVWRQGGRYAVIWVQAFSQRLEAGTDVVLGMGVLPCPYARYGVAVDMCVGYSMPA